MPLDFAAGGVLLQQGDSESESPSQRRPFRGALRKTANGNPQAKKLRPGFSRTY